MSEKLTKTQVAALVDALKREREGYVATGKTDRVKQVDAEIKRLTSGKAEAEEEDDASAPAGKGKK